MKLRYCLILICTSLGSHAQNPIITVDHSQEIVFGQSAGFTGHFKYYATMIRDGILAYFECINKAGGIQGKKLRLVSLDDKSDVELTKKNIEMLYHTHGITKFIGVMGTRGILSILPLVKEKKIALFFPWGNDPSFNDPHLTNIINGPGMLNPQIDAIINHIVNVLKIDNIAIFCADDDFSQSAMAYAEKKLQAMNIKPIAQATYNRFTMNIEKPASQLMDVDPRTIVCISTAMPMVKLINNFFKKGFFGTKFFGIDSTFTVKAILADQGSSIQYTSIVPDPLQSTLEIAQQYKQCLAQLMQDPDYSILSFTYFIGAAILCQALKGSLDYHNNAALITALESLKNSSIGGFPIHFDQGNRSLFGETIWLI